MEQVLDFSEWLRRVSGDSTQAEIATRVGIDQTAVSRWLLGRSQPRLETMISIARAYGRNPVEAMLATGVLERDEVGGVIELPVSLSGVSSKELLAELGRRLRVGQGAAEHQPENGPVVGPQWTVEQTMGGDEPRVGRYQSGNEVR